MRNIYVLVDKKSGKLFNFFQQGQGANIFKIFYENREDAKFHQTSNQTIRKLELKQNDIRTDN